MKILIPIYRAKKIDSDEYIFGTGTTDRFLKIEVKPKNFNDGKLWLFSLYQWIEIDPSTLEISFDGKKWYLVETISSAVKLLENMTVEEFRLKVTGIQE